MSGRPPMLGYATPAASDRRTGWSGCLVGVLGAVASWGPVGILAGIVARELSRQEPSPARPSSDYGIPAFFTGVLTWAVVGIAGSVVSVLLGMRAHYRASAQANHRP